MIVYRLMCKKEADGICENFPLSWNSRFKWFTDNANFLNRVLDGKFNNSEHVDKYTHLAVYTVGNMACFKRVSDHELMLSRKNEPMAKIKLLEICKMIEVGNIYEITQQWLELEGNDIFPKLMPQFKVGALFEIVEFDSFGSRHQAIAVKCLETGETLFIENSPISAYSWCFFSHLEVNRGYLTYKGTTK